MRTVGLYTLGCKVSQYETEAIAEEFVRQGFTVAPFGSVCDVYVINTCTVTAESDRKSRQIIRRAVSANPSAIVAVVGCYSQRDPIGVSNIAGVDIVIGTNGKLGVVGRAIELLDRGKQKSEISVTSLDGARFEPMRIERAPRTRAYVKIEDGCECKCTYCAISGARGPVRSKPREAVIEEVEALYRGGTREIVLTGIETGSYGRDFDEKYTLADLIAELDGRHSADRIRLGSLAPELVGEEFVERVKNARILAPHFHLSMQSGSNRILRLMKRRYSREQALANIKRIRDNIPNVQFTTDLMVGFPTETEEDFLDTVSFLREAEFLNAHIFAYSRREGTPAHDFDGQIAEEVKRRRSEALMSVKSEVTDRILERLTRDARELSVILETERGGVYSAHSDSFVEVSVRAPLGMQGEMVRVGPVSHKNGVVIAEML